MCPKRYSLVVTYTFTRQHQFISIFLPRLILQGGHIDGSSPPPFSNVTPCTISGIPGNRLDPGTFNLHTAASCQTDYSKRVNKPFDIFIIITSYLNNSTLKHFEMLHTYYFFQTVDKITFIRLPTFTDRLPSGDCSTYLLSASCNYQ